MQDLNKEYISFGNETLNQHLPNMETATNILTGSIVQIPAARLYDMWAGDIIETRLEFLNIMFGTQLLVRIEKFEGQYGSDDLTLYGTTIWQHSQYKVKIVFAFHPDGNPEKVAGRYELRELDSDDPSHPLNMGKELS